jgi:hypothetical protein
MSRILWAIHPRIGWFRTLVSPLHSSNSYGSTRELDDRYAGSSNEGHAFSKLVGHGLASAEGLRKECFENCWIIRDHLRLWFPVEWIPVGFCNTSSRIETFPQPKQWKDIEGAYKNTIQAVVPVTKLACQYIPSHQRLLPICRGVYMLPRSVVLHRLGQSGRFCWSSS